MRHHRAPASRYIRLGSLHTLHARLERLACLFGRLRETVDARAEGGDGVEVDLHALRPRVSGGRG